MQTLEQPAGIENIIVELEKRYPQYKKMDIYSTVNDSFHKIHSVFKPISEAELEEIKSRANHELSL